MSRIPESLHTSLLQHLKPLEKIGGLSFLDLSERREDSQKRCELSTLKSFYSSSLCLQKKDLKAKTQKLFILVNHHYSTFWESKPQKIAVQTLLELWSEGEEKAEIQIRGVLWKEKWSFEVIQEFLNTHAASPLESLAKHHHAALWNMEHAMILKPVHIPKPWGEEIWYTGMEARGVAQIHDAFGTTPLPALISLFPESLLGNTAAESMILLKTLNPCSDEVLGDLYLEVHQKKWEIYIVVALDPSAWPSGIAKIRAGFDSEILQKYQKKCGADWDSQCLQDFGKALAEYETVRKKIECCCSEKLSENLILQEEKLRHKATSFVGEFEVQLGDVFCFPAGEMHSLQHGIEVVEFQTPHYERLILMFAQKVLTQSHWDIKAGLSLVKHGTYKPMKPVLEHETKCFKIECIVDFPDFLAYRVTLSPEARISEVLQNQYHLLMVVQGKAKLIFRNTEIHLGAKEAVLIPAASIHYQVQNLSTEALIYLKAVPS